MKKIVLLILGMSISMTIFSQTPIVNMPEGEKLERQHWVDDADKNFANWMSTTSSQIQVVDTQGVIDYKQYLSQVKNLKLGKYVLKDFKTTQVGDTLIITFWAAAKEQINDKTLSTKFTPRLSVWQKTKDGWKKIAFANLNTVN
jgi:hypothetical protein